MMPAGQWHLAAAAGFCSWVARLRAPEIAVHRIHVIPRCSRWSLVLADAACCLLVEAVRSGSHARARLLGFFLVDFPLAQ